MKITSELIKDRVYLAALTTKGFYPKTNGFLKPSTRHYLLKTRHSPIKEYELMFMCEDVPKRAVSHIARHKEIGIYISTSRPDIKDKKDRNLMMLTINAKRLIEISEQRLCISDVWHETLDFWKELLKTIPDPMLKKFCVAPCVHRNMCVGKESCGFFNTSEYKKQRNQILKYE